MLVKVISLTFNSATGGFDDRELCEFIKDKDVISVRDHLFVRNEVPYLTLVVKYFPAKAVSTEKAATAIDNKREDNWQDLLSEAELEFFNALRDWRNVQARKEAMPPYLLFNNKQFVEVVKQRPSSIEQLAKISGVGKSRAEKYGAEILQIVNAQNNTRAVSQV